MGQSKKAPDFSLEKVMEFLVQAYGLSGELSPLPSYIDLNFKLLSGEGEAWVVKIANSSHSPNELDFENQAMELLAKTDLGFAVPFLKSSANGNMKETILDQNGIAHCCRVISFLPGKLWADANVDMSRFAPSLGRCVATLDRTMENFTHAFSGRYLNWDLKNAVEVVSRHMHAVDDPGNFELVHKILRDFENRVLPFYKLLPQQIIHNDINDYNLLVTDQNVSGVFDFGDMVKTFRIANLAIAAAYAVMKQADPAGVIHQLIVAYHKENPLKPVEIEVFLDMLKMRLAVSVCMSSYEYQQRPENDYLLVSQADAWDAIKVLGQIDGIALVLKLKHLCAVTVSGDESEDTRSISEIINFRKQHLSENLSLAYEQPLKIVRGQGTYLYSETGDRYIDMVNNVCHVGHCHPAVVAAGQRQMAQLNTNTRYLHDNIIEFSEKLLSTMPPELSVCMFVNSGSEANELALRLARNYTGAKNMVVVEGGYHGNTNATVDISPYKYDGPGGTGERKWVKQTLVPDPYRGHFRGRTPETGQAYSDDVAQVASTLAKQGHGLCGFICESIQGVGGQIVHPPGYLESAYANIRDFGGVCIADEVQVGMGRVGSHWWAFQAQNAVPDIVTIGKPLGNGHPVAAVVTTKAIADAFVTGMEYFNTFGGNPVSCAIGGAVFDTIQEEGLIEHALETGNYLQQGLLDLMEDFPVIGDVRGMGMFIGAEFVSDRKTLNPARSQIDFVIEALKKRGVLLTTEGPHHNVLKIKPPLAFAREDADYFLAQLRDILSQNEAKV